MPEPGGELALRLLPLALVVAPLVFLRGHVDFARLPQQAFVELAALGLGLLWIAQGAHARGSFGRALDLPLFLFLGWSTASLAWASDPGAGRLTLAQWAACAVVYVVVSRAARPADAPRLAGGLLLGGALVAVVGLGQALLGLDLVPQAAAPSATMANRNVAAGYLAALAPLALWPWSNRRVRSLAVLAAIAMLAFLPFTRSRTALTAVALQLLLLGLAEARLTPLARPRRLATAALLAASLALVLGAAWVSRSDPEKARSASIRFRLAGSAARMALDRPLLGVGLGGFGALYSSQGPVVTSLDGVALRVDSPHNESLQVLTETGLPGVLAAFWVAAAAVIVIRRLRRSPDPAVRRTALALGLALCGFAVDAALGFPLRYPVPPLALAVLLGLLAALDARPPLATPTLATPTLRGAGPRPLLARPLRLAAALSLAVLLALSWSASRTRLEADRGRHLGAFLPAAHAQSCAPGVTLARAPDGTLELSVRAVPLPEVLSCLVARAGLRVEYDGPPPRPSVSVTLRGESLAATLASLLEGLGVNYLLSRDPAGAAVERLIVFGTSRSTGAPGGGGAPSSIAEPTPDGEEAEPFGPPPAADPGRSPRSAGPGPPRRRCHGSRRRRRRRTRRCRSRSSRRS